MNKISISDIDLKNENATYGSTCDPIYENNTRKTLEGNKRQSFVLLASTLLAIGTFVSITFMQFDNYIAYQSDRYEYINSTLSFCHVFDIVVNVQVISTSIAIALIIFYVILFKRRVFLRYRFKYRNVGLPMIVSCWNKNERLFSSFIYGLIALNVFEILYNSISGQSNMKKFVQFKDPTGLLSLLFKIIEIIFIGLSKILFVILFFIILE
jgi:hypothetical protein